MNQIFDNFISKLELESWQKRSNEALQIGAKINPEGTELFNKIKELIKLKFRSCRYYKIDSSYKLKPHKDPGEFVALFYPFDSDAGLGIYNDKDELINTIEVKQNRLILFDCSENKHAQIPPKQGFRYSIPFKFLA